MATDLTGSINTFLTTKRGAPIGMPRAEGGFTATVDQDLGGGSGAGSAITVPNLASLETLEIPTVPEGQRFSVVVLGFYTPGDYGAGIFYWDPTRAKNTQNGGTIVAPEAIALWDKTQAGIEDLILWGDVEVNQGVGCFVRTDPEFYIEYFGASSAYVYNDRVLNALTRWDRHQRAKGYGTYQISGQVNFLARTFDLMQITLKPINAIPLAAGEWLFRTSSTAASIKTSRYCTIKINGNAGSISGGASNAENQANAYQALLIYGDRTPKSRYIIDLSDCTHGVKADADVECSYIEVHASYVDYLVNEVDGDENHWAVFAKYSGQFFKTDGQSSGYVFFMVEQSRSLGVPCIDIRGGKSYSVGGLVRAIDGQPIIIDDSPTGGNGTGHINFDDLQIIQVRNSVGMHIKNVDVVTGSFYMENYTAGGVVLDDIRCAAGLTINMSDCRGGVPVTLTDLGTTLGFNSKININISRSTGGTPSTNAIEILSTYNATLNIGQCMGNILVGSAVTGVHLDLDADFIRNNKSITVQNPVGHLTARVGGVVTLAWLDTRVKSWAFNGLQFGSVYRDNTFSSPMVWNNTGFVAANALVSNSAQLSVAKDLYKINNLMKVRGAGVYLADVNKVVYPAGTDPDDNWVDAAGVNVITGIDTAELKYACTFSGPISYDLATDRFTGSRPDSNTSGQLLYAVPNGTYDVEISNISGGTLAIRDDATILDTVAVGVTATRTVTITSGQLRINNQFYPHDTVFQVLSILPA